MDTMSVTPANQSERTTALLKAWFGWDIEREFDYVSLENDGIPATVIAGLAKHVGKDLGWIVSPRTLQRRTAAKENLTSDESAKAIRVARIAAQATAIFGCEQKSQRWLTKPKDQLDGQSPMAMLRSESGARLVSDMLVAIDEGYF